LIFNHTGINKYPYKKTITKKHLPKILILKHELLHNLQPKNTLNQILLWTPALEASSVDPQD